MPDEMLDQMLRRLDAQAAALAKPARYYAGAHDLALASAKFRAAFGGMLKALSCNWCRLVVDATAERLVVNGFRLSGAGADDDAWRLWQANDLDANAQALHAEALALGRAATLTWPGANGQPRITVESARQVYVETAPGDRRERVAAVKRWRDRDGYGRAVLFTPETVRRFRSTTRAPDDALDAPGTFVEEDAFDNPLRAVPVVPFLNRPDVLGVPASEIADVIPLQDAANKILADAVVASEYSAFRQRWATGLEIPTDPESGQPVEPFDAAVSRLWVAEDSQARFGQFDASDLANYVTMLDSIAQQVFAITSTPAHYYSAFRGQYPSGDAIRSAEAGLVTKVRRAQVWLGESWEETLRLGFAVLGDSRAHETGAETLWANPETRTDAERADALTKLAAIGVPSEVLWELWGFSPQAIARMRAASRREVLDRAAVDLGPAA